MKVEVIGDPDRLKVREGKANKLKTEKKVAFAVGPLISRTTITYTGCIKEVNKFKIAFNLAERLQI